jgi:hypothetical protein
MVPAMRDDELLAAYVDGVAELTPDERRRAEAAADASELAATRDLLDRLRAVPSQAAGEPDWAAMERAIRAQLPARVPRAWWRVNLRWLVPVLACATAATAAILALSHQSQQSSEADHAIATAVPTAPSPAVPTPAVAAKDPHAGHAFVFLDGEAIDVDDTPEAQLLDSLKPAPGHEAAGPDEDEDSNDGLLGSPGLAWVDDLDSSKLDRLENVLVSKKKGM